MGQVLQSPYDFDKARVIVREMADMLSLDLVDKGLVTDQIVLAVGYDRESLSGGSGAKQYTGPVTTDRYGRKVPKHAHGTANLGRLTASTKRILEAATELYERIVDRSLLVRRVTIAANHVVDEREVSMQQEFEQMDLFSNLAETQSRQAEETAALERERNMQRAVSAIKKKYGKNAILKGMNFQEGATARDRNRQVGGHRE